MRVERGGILYVHAVGHHVVAVRLKEGFLKTVGANAKGLITISTHRKKLTVTKLRALVVYGLGQCLTPLIDQTTTIPT